MKNEFIHTNNQYQQNLGISQMDLGVNAPRKTFLYRINRFMTDLERRLEIMPFWKNLSYVFLLLSTIFFPAIILILMITRFESIPIDMPVFYNPQTNSWTLINKAIVIMLPIGYAIINLILLNLIYSVFQFDRRLAQILGLTINLANMLFIIAFAQILSIILL